MNVIQKLKSKLLTKLFIEWVNDEWDISTLQATKALIAKRENFLKTMIHMSKRKTVIGFGR